MRTGAALIRTVLLPLLLGIVACAAGRSIRVVVATPSDISADQVQSLRSAVAQAGRRVDWIDVSRRPSQVAEDGYSTLLLAEAVRAAVNVAPELCRGELIQLTMRGNGFARNQWRVHKPEQYAIFDLRGRTCSNERSRSERFWVRGVPSDEELLSVLRTFYPRLRTRSSSHLSPTLMEGERIISVERKAGSDRVSIEVLTVNVLSEGHGRVLVFERQNNTWVGRVTGGWIA